MSSDAIVLLREDHEQLREFAKAGDDEAPRKQPSAPKQAVHAVTAR
ncbi:hypothetical protein [Nocardia sp. NPDC057227]